MGTHFSVASFAFTVIAKSYWPLMGYSLFGNSDLTYLLHCLTQSPPPCDVCKGVYYNIFLANTVGVYFLSFTY
jgi:hypothetical protein